VVVDVGLESLGLELTTSLGLGLEALTSVGWGLEFVSKAGRGDPEAIASCFASKPCKMSFNSRPRPRSSSSPVVVSICINFFWLERQRLTRSTIISSFTASRSLGFTACSMSLKSSITFHIESILDKLKLSISVAIVSSSLLEELLGIPYPA